MRRLLLFASIVLAASFIPTPASAGGSPLRTYAVDTWRSMVAMTDPATGLPADNIGGDLSAASRSKYTSPTNIGAYLWSTVVARDLGLISRTEAVKRVDQTLGTLSALVRHPASGMFYNWYDPHTGAVLHTFPPDGSTITPFLSSVDNGWLAAALLVVQGSVPEARPQAGKLVRSMNFGAFYDPNGQAGGKGLLWGGFYDTEPSGCSVPGDGVWYTCNHYDITVTEPRIATLHRDRAGPDPTDARTSRRGARSRPPATGHGWSSSRPASTPPTSASRCTRAPTPTAASGSCRAGAATCSRRSCRTCSCPRSSGARGAGVATIRRPSPGRSSTGWRRQVRLLGLLAGLRPVRRLQGVGRRGDGHGPDRLPVRRGGLELRRRVRRLPSGRTGSHVRRRGGDAARGRSSLCGTRPARRWPTSRGSRRTSAATGRAASTTRSRCAATPWPGAISPSTRG